jgi:hypothetical protein
MVARPHINRGLTIFIFIITLPHTRGLDLKFSPYWKHWLILLVRYLLEDLFWMSLGLFWWKISATGVLCLIILGEVSKICNFISCIEWLW